VFLAQFYTFFVLKTGSYKAKSQGVEKGVEF
jgi:hypothetical protein